MFLWLELLKVDDSLALITNKAVEAKVLFIPGQVSGVVDRLVPNYFAATKCCVWAQIYQACSPTNSKSNFVRASFSTATDQEMDTAMQRFAKLLK